ncbi:caspase-1-like [Schistocerca cancellata]|uniref:caspase-1-like n=1 Tax=Schistocerca cancellata TaxID=274614 RepID=UPI0021180A2A|nr:caspase-1-like [Schistocerca cancellata]
MEEKSVQVSELKKGRQEDSLAKPSDDHAKPSEQDEAVTTLHDGTRISKPSRVTQALPNPGVSKDDEEYFMRNTKRRLAVVFNHYEYDIREYKDGELYRPPRREGTSRDRDAVLKTFSKLGFKVVAHDNKRYEEIKEILAEVAQQDHSEHDCLAVIVLTHGERGGRLDAKDRVYDARRLWEPFIASSCRTLAGKPKLFFIQACKGRTRDPGAIVRNCIGDSTDAAAVIPASFQVPSFADFLIAYSTFEGLYSFRHPTNGSWFIQTLCTQLGKHAGDKDVVSLLTDVNRIVGQEFRSSDPSEPCMDGLVQGPCFISSLTRRVHLWPPVAAAPDALPNVE